ncbi:hypothetical protein DPX16_15525 [Anabarilius grahami]|uniref:Uncharacterized protein n=1 Tax=Anabarilius grahami TaxID=495550 RepID=A0A3N0XCJ9_ANAGA|nr:hypothetical protein DPX16_15525 [Anabarilius grahami]
MEAAALMDRKEPLVEQSARGPFLNVLSWQPQPAERCFPNTQQLAYTTARGALAAGRDDVKHESHRHPLVLASRGEVREREYNSLKPPNELICEPYDCSHRYVSAQTGPESPGTNADTSSLGKSAKRERSVPIGRRSQ